MVPLWIGLVTGIGNDLIKACLESAHHREPRPIAKVKTEAPKRSD